MALPQDYNKIVSTDKLGHGTAINAGIDGFLQLGYDRFTTQTLGGLNWAYYAGSIRFGVTLVNIAAGSLVLANNATNYIYATSAGAVASNTTGTISPNYPIAEVVTSSGAIASYTDKRSFLNNDLSLDFSSITKEPTGFTDPSNVVVTYDPTARTITLTGTVAAYFKGVLIPVLNSGWVSAAHAATNGIWFLSYDGTNFNWELNNPWTFDKLQIAFVNYGVNDKFAMRETHGMMPWQAHEELHNIIGTYKKSGGQISNYVLSSTTATDRRPDVAATTIADEDLITTNAILTSKLYTKLFLSAKSTVNYTVETAEIVPLSGNNPYYNQWNGSAWVQTLMANNSHMSVWLISMPVTASSGSQKYRYLWVQGQANSTNLSTEQSLQSQTLNLGNLTNDASEFVFIARFIIKYAASNWTIEQVDILNGNKYTQISSPAGQFVSSPAGLNKELQFNDNGVFGADSYLTWDKTNHRMGIGDFSSRTIDFQLHLLKNATLEIGLETNNDAVAGPRLIGCKSRGNPITPTAINSGDQMSIFGGKGYHSGSGYSGLVGYVSVAAAENFTATAQGSKIVFAVTPAGSTSSSIVEKVTINSNGNLLIGATTDGWKLLVTPIANATAGQTALFQDRTATTGSTKVVFKAGAGQSTNTIFELQDSSAVLYTSFSASSFFTKSTIDQKTSTIGGIATFASIQPTNSGGSYITLAAGTAGTTARGYIGWTHNGSGSDMLFVGEAADALAIRAESTLEIGISTVLKMQLTSTELKIKTKLGIIETGSSPQYYTFLQGGDQSGDLTYTLPTAYPAGNDYALLSSTGGTMSWGAIMTNPMSADGDIIIRSGGVAARLPKGADGEYLKLVSGLPAWAAVSSGMTNPMTTTGDIIYSSDNSGTPQRLAATTDGYVLTLASGIPSWVASSGGLSPLTEGGTNKELYRTNYPVAGNTRGAGAVDFVYERSGATMVASGAHSGLLSGRDNTCAGIRSVVCGGVNNIINTAYSGAGLYDGDSVICGGYLNSISQYHLLCAIGGGSTNQITTASSYIQMCTIGGGYNNLITSGATANASYHTISGGTANSITGQYGSTIAGGNTNVIYDGADYATIGGGKNNTIVASAYYACIPGGRSNTAGQYSFACGYNANGSNLQNTFTFADGTSTTPARASAAIFGVAGGFKIRMNNSETFEFYYDGANSLTHSSGAVLTTGGVWTDASSRTLKTKIAEIDNKEILKKLMTINPERWKYKSDMDTKTEHIGLYSEDFYDTFGIGSRNGLGATDLCGVLWAAVQALKSEIDEIKNSIKN